MGKFSNGWWYGNHLTWLVQEWLDKEVALGIQFKFELDPKSLDSSTTSYPNKIYEFHLLPVRMMLVS